MLTIFILYNINFLLKQKDNSTDYTEPEEILNPTSCQNEYKDLTTMTVTADLSNNLECLYRIHVQLLSKKVRFLSRKYKHLQTKLGILQGLISRTAYDIVADIRTKASNGFEQKVKLGTMFTLAKTFPINTEVSWSLHNVELRGIKKIIRTVMHTISNAHHENIQFHALYYGYISQQPISGQEFRLSIFTTKERHITTSRVEFGAIQSKISKTFRKTTVNIVIPLAGRLEMFTQFMKNLERNILKKHDPISVLVVYFPETASLTEHKKIFDAYSSKYNGSKFTWLNLTGKFARARALQAAVDFYKDNKLLFFADVDLSFNTDFLQRCRDNTVHKKRLYFPVMFKLFNPKISGFNLKSTDSFQSFDKGDWARYSFGPVCAYRNDVIYVGGFNVNIKEWGYEDIQLFEAFISKNSYDVIRAADPGLLHIYHPHTKCGSITNNIQRLMCNGAMFNSLSSKESTVNYLLAKNYLVL